MKTQRSKQQLILGSSSPYRKKLLENISSDFICVSPDIDETPKLGESTIELVTRLSTEKSQAIANQYPNALIIGSDQVCEFTSPTTQLTEIIGKPKTHAKATAHLKAVSGQSVTLQTGLALYNAATDTLQTHVESFQITFRELSDELIESYLIADEPYFCAGAVKAESLGIILIKKMQGNDFNALIGLPLIELVTLLNNEDYPLLHKKIT